jgi:hypothetical protein
MNSHFKPSALLFKHQRSSSTDYQDSLTYKGQDLSLQRFNIHQKDTLKRILKTSDETEEQGSPFSQLKERMQIKDALKLVLGKLPEVREEESEECY